MTFINIIYIIDCILFEKLKKKEGFIEILYREHDYQIVKIYFHSFLKILIII